jgi:hypothetical protein
MHPIFGELLHYGTSSRMLAFSQTHFQTRKHQIHTPIPNVLVKHECSWRTDPELTHQVIILSRAYVLVQTPYFYRLYLSAFSVHLLCPVGLPPPLPLAVLPAMNSPAHLNYSFWKCVFYIINILQDWIFLCNHSMASVADTWFCGGYGVL